MPDAARLDGLVDLPPAMGEIEVERAISRMAARNLAAGSVPFFIGGGAYRHHIPAAVDHLIQRGEFLTSYTPYQPEMAQGTLQYLFEFQTQVALLTGMEVANASLYDGATACAEAVMMANRVTRRRRRCCRAGCIRITARCARPMRALSASSWPRRARLPAAARISPRSIDGDTSCVVVQNPDFFGEMRDYSALAQACHDAGRAAGRRRHRDRVAGRHSARPARWVPTSSPAEGQSLGNALNFGGPYLGLFASREKFVRQMPGRLVGQTVDADGRRGWVLTLSTREQHIRREKATSNICTNSGLCALAFTIHLALLGEAGLHPARRAQPRRGGGARRAARARAGGAARQPSFFNEFTLRLPRPAAPVVEALAEHGVLAGVPVSRLYPEPARARRSAAGGGDRDRDRRATSTGSNAGLAEVLRERLEPGGEHAVPPQTAPPRPRRSAATAGCRSRSR